MLTTQSIFEELQSENKCFSSFKELFDSVGKIWQKHYGVLPVEIGPKDIIELAVLRQWIQQDPAGGLKVVVHPNLEESLPSKIRLKATANSRERLSFEKHRTGIISRDYTRQGQARSYNRVGLRRSAASGN